MDDAFFNFDMSFGLEDEEPDIPASFKFSKEKTVPEKPAIPQPDLEQTSMSLNSFGLETPEKPAIPQSAPVQSQTNLSQVNEYKSASKTEESISEDMFETAASDGVSNDLYQSFNQLSFSPNVSTPDPFVSENLQDFERQDNVRIPSEVSAQIWDSAMPQNMFGFYDNDELEADLPSEIQYCLVLRNPNENYSNPEWFKQCQSLFPKTSEQLFADLQNWMLGKEKVFHLPKIIMLQKSWTISEILNHSAMWQELLRTSQLIWDETIRQAEGTESPEWIKALWIMKMMQHIEDYFMICMR